MTTKQVGATTTKIETETHIKQTPQQQQQQQQGGKGRNAQSKGALGKAMHSMKETAQGIVSKAEALVGRDTSTTDKKAQLQEGPSFGTTTLKAENKEYGSTNRGVVFHGQGKMRVDTIPYPKMELPWNKQPVNNGAILKVLTAGICGSDLHPYRGRTPMQSGTILGHEFTGEIVELGSGVQHMKVGDWGAVPFNVACGTCSNCKSQRPDVCYRTNHQQEQFGQAGIYGYVCGGDWAGGQAEFIFVPFVDYNFIRFENKTLAKTKLTDLTLLTDVLPTAMHGTEEAQVAVGQTVYIAGAGPIGLTAAALCNLKGASRIIVGDFITERLELARQLGCLTIDLSTVADEKALGAKLNEMIGCKWVDCSIECVGYEARGFGSSATTNNVCTAALAACCEVTKPGGRVGILGAFFAGDPKAPSAAEKVGMYSFNLGTAWMKGICMQGGQASCMRYVERLQNMILADKLPISKLLNVKVLPLDQAALAYDQFDKGVAHKFILDPHNTLGLAGTTRTSAATTADTTPLADE